MAVRLSALCVGCPSLKGSFGISPKILLNLFNVRKCFPDVDLKSHIILERQLSRMVSSGMLRRVALVRTEVSEEPSASLIRVTRIGELETTQAATSNRRMLRRNSCHPDEGVTRLNIPKRHHSS
jgi:hypothetical protein